MRSDATVTDERPSRVAIPYPLVTAQTALATHRQVRPYRGSMRGPKQDGVEKTLTVVSLVVVVAAFITLLIDPRAFWLNMVVAFALALNPLAQLHQQRRLGRSGRGSYVTFVGLATLGLFQLFILSLDGFPTWVSVAVAAFTMIVIAGAVTLWKSSLRDRQPGRGLRPHPAWPAG